LVEGELIVNLMEEPDFVEQYVQLRNRHCDVLLTTPVNITDTKEWLKNNDIEIRGITRNNKLIGVTILYLNRQGEIAFFTSVTHQGVGSRLLSVIESVARERGLSEVWAWVLSDNIIAQRTFEKSGYRRDRESTKEYQKKTMNGFVLRKGLF
jgi:RimJ/RimL family protein N-acetyltransferase